jgi:hypothetical protein
MSKQLPKAVNGDWYRISSAWEAKYNSSIFIPVFRAFSNALTYYKVMYCEKKKKKKKMALQISLEVFLKVRGCIQKFPDWVDNVIYAYLWYYSLRSNTKDYGKKLTILTHEIAIQLHLLA